MQQGRYGRTARGGLVEAAFQPAGGTGENNLRHGSPVRPRDPSLPGEPGAAKLFGLLDVSNGIEQAPEWGGDQIDDG